MRYLVALDVDGTLIDHDGHMSGAVRQASRSAIVARHHVIVATGRTVRATLPILESIGIIRGYAVCSNGGTSIRLDPSLPNGYETLFHSAFDPRPVLAALREQLPTAKFAVEDVNGDLLATERFFDPIFGAETQALPFAQLQTREAIRVVLFSSDNSEAELGETLNHLGMHGVTYMVGHTAWLDIAAEGVSKASALEQLRERIGVLRMHTVAVGDGRNDIEMLSWAAHGVAMGQASPEVRAASREVTGTVQEDGAAAVLQTLLLEH